MRALLSGLLLISVAACATIERAALPSPELLGASYAEAAPVARQQVDHSTWDTFLGQYLRQDAAGVNRIAYSAVTDADRAELDRYLAALQATNPETLTRDQQLAFWINLYNALTVDVILDNYPVASIRDITDGAFSFGPWDRELATVGGRALTLNDIEHRIIRPVYDEPRIHYALNCAARTCPNLMDRAWKARTLEADLEAAERSYVNDPRGVSVDANGNLVLSKIYIWFREDFGPNEQAVIARLAQYAEPSLKEVLENTTRVGSYQYDWSLNEIPPGL